jgi:hypothetical protein
MQRHALQTAGAGRPCKGKNIHEVLNLTIREALKFSPTYPMTENFGYSTKSG